MLRRFPTPLITPEMLPGENGHNICGPSLIRAPDWLPGRLGTYYLYFAHHHGTYIRLAYADRLEGPWRVHAPGTLHLSNAPGDMDHIASPDVHVDDARRMIRMYFHGRQRNARRQFSHVAQSRNGMEFVCQTEPIADFYLRMVRWRNEWIGMSKGGVMYRSPDGLTGFERLPQPAFAMSDAEANGAGDVRHVALEAEGDTLTVYFSRIGDRPEAIRRATVDLRQPPERWRAGRARLVLRPETSAEGANLPKARSRSGPAPARENAVRDPAIFIEHGRRYLLYSIAGEAGIGMVDLVTPARIARAVMRRLRPSPRVAAQAAVPATTASVEPDKRIYVMGCGRSGTWLLTALFATFRGVEIFPDETPVETFARHLASKPVLVLKRDSTSYQNVEDIPHNIAIAWIVRHPFDVLTSHNPTTGHKFHIQPHRWLGEMLALQYLMATARPNTTIVRYEDLVTRPEAIQGEIASAFGLEAEAGVDQIAARFRPSDAADRAMHGLRPIDRDSLDKFRRDPEKLAYLRSILPRLGGTLQWVAETFGYDVTL